MGSFNLDEFNKVLTAALSPLNPGMPGARMEIIEKLKAFFDEIDSVMAEENNIYVDSFDATNRFGSVMREMRRIIDSINPLDLDFFSARVSLFNSPLKNYFKKVEKLNEDFCLVVDEIDKLGKSFRFDLTTMNITLASLRGKATKLDEYNAELAGILDLINGAGRGIDKSDPETIMFMEKRIRDWVESLKSNLSKSIVVTNQRILTVSLSIENTNKIIETLKTTKTVTVELFGNIINLANEKYRQKIVFGYSAGASSADGNSIKDAFQRVESVLPKQ